MQSTLGNRAVLRSVVFLVVVSAVVISAAALADEVDAADLADKGSAAAAAGKYESAVALFREARLIDDRPEYVCNIATAFYRWKKFPEAHVYFEQCLARAGSVSEAYVTVARETLAYIEGELRKGEFAPVDVVVSPTAALVRPSYLPDQEALPGARTLWFSFGTHSIVVSAPSHVAHTAPVQIATRKRVALKISLEIETPSKPTVDPRVDPGIDPGMDPANVLDSPARPEPARGAARSRTPAVVSFIAAGAFVAGGAIAHGVAAGTRSDLAELEATDPDRPDTLSEFETQRAVAIGLYAAGAVAAGVGAVLWIRASRPAPVRLDVGPDGAGGSAVMLQLSSEL